MQPYFRYMYFSICDIAQFWVREENYSLTILTSDPFYSTEVTLLKFHDNCVVMTHKLVYLLV